VARKCAANLESIILEECSDTGSAIDYCSHAVSAFQSVASRQSEDGVDFPMEVAPPDSSQGQSSNGGGYSFVYPGSMPAYVDEAIFSDFLARQGSVLEEFEGHLLNIEKGSSVESCMHAVRRLLHTLKGETALLGLQDLEQLCHAAEDAIQLRPPRDLVDSLLAVKDWLGKSFDYFSGKGPQTAGLDSILQQLKGKVVVPTPIVPGAQQTAAAPAPAPSPKPVAAPKEASSEEPRLLEGDPSLMGDFVVEANEHLENADVQLLTLETDPHDKDAINAVFRAFHTIKGVAGFLGLDQVQAVSHEAENLLDRARKNELDLVAENIDVVFDTVDVLKSLVRRLSDMLAEGTMLLSREPGVEDFVDHLRAVLAGYVAPQPAPTPAASPGQRLGDILVDKGSASTDTVDAAVLMQATTPKNKRLGEILVEDSVASRAQVREAMEIQEACPEETPRTGELLVKMGVATPDEVDKALERQRVDSDPPKLGEVLVRSGEVSGHEVALALRAQKTVTQQQPVIVHEAMKVDADRLDRLLDTIGELVITESMVSQSSELKALASPELARHLSQLDKITRELQEMGTSLRMIPIRSTFQKMARLARDLAKKSGKQVEFSTFGDDTELDKSVVDKIGDPLVHMVRNSVDHGIEATSGDRIRAGKTAVGHVELHAFHKGGSIYIEIRDDGRGLDRDAILAKARERGLLRPDETPPDRDIWGLIFEPGFSTAKQVTDVSGRGVGMDVVRRNIEQLRGQIEIQTERGKGCVLSIRLPLTLAIIDGMVVRVGEERYIIPTLSIVMSLRPDATELSSVVGRGEMLRLQGKLLPMYRVGRLFEIPNSVADAMNGIVVVVEDEGRQMGLLIDDILGQQQIVIKSLGETMQDIPGIAGGAIMPDGNVGLILDVGGLVKLAHEHTEGTS
jgi:two-component system chemotaxis sensor kinase CheA